MCWKRALQQPAIRLLSNSKSNCLRSFSTNCDGLSFAKTATTSPAIVLPIRRPPRKFVNVSRSFNTAAEIKTGITDIQRNLMWKKTIENGHMEWPADLKRAFKGIRSSIAVISLPCGEIQATGTILSPDGYIVTTASVFKSLKASETAQTKVKVVIHENEYDAAQVVLIDYQRNIALVKVNPKDGFLEVPKFSEWRKSSLFPHFYVGTCNPIDNAPNQFMGKRYTRNYYEINEGNKQHELLKLSPVEGQCYFSYHDDKASYDDFRSNLGGPVVNKNGQVVGIVTTTSCCNDFALPSRLLFKIFRHFLENGKDAEPYAELIEDPITPGFIYSHEAKSDDDCYYDDDDYTAAADDDNHLFAKKGEKNDNIAQVHADDETPMNNNDADNNSSGSSGDDDDTSGSSDSDDDGDISSSSDSNDEDGDTSSSSEDDDGDASGSSDDDEDVTGKDDESTIIDAKTGTSEGALPESIPVDAKTSDEVVLPNTEIRPSITSNNNVDHHEGALPDSEIRPMLSIANEILRLQRTLLSDPNLTEFRSYADGMESHAQNLLDCVRKHEEREKADLETSIKFLDQTYDDVFELQDHFHARVGKVEDVFAKARRTIEDMRARAFEEQKRFHRSDSEY